MSAPSQEDIDRELERPSMRAARLLGFLRGASTALEIMSQHDLVGTPAWFAVLKLVATCDEENAEAPVPPPKKATLTVIDGGAA
jgi:hypothetical protein